MVSCTEECSKVSYTDIDSLMQETEYLRDSAVKNLELLYIKNDSLLDIYFPKL
jgi:hypothetical protein